jgi:hypothetical protein
MTQGRSVRLSLGMGALTLALVAGLMAAPAGAMGMTPHLRHAQTSGQLATIVSADRHGVTYRLPSGRLLTLGKGRAHFEQEPGTVDFTSTGTISTAAGVDYHLSVDATRYLEESYGTIVVVTLEREASGASGKAIQYHTYVFQVATSALQFSETGPQALLTTDTGLAEWGSISLSFTSRRGPIDTCHGNAEFWRGSSAGTMSFTPQADNGFFGTIERSVFRTARLSVDTGCGYPPPLPPAGITRRCPTPGAFAYGETDSLTRSFSIQDAAVGADNDEYATLQIARDPALIIHEIDANSTTSGLIVGLEGTATLVALPDSFMSGSAAFTPEGHFYIQGPYSCGDGRTFRFRYQGGEIAGTPGDPFTVGFDTGAVTMPTDPDDSMYAELDKVIVR